VRSGPSIIGATFSPPSNRSRSGRGARIAGAHGACYEPSKKRISYPSRVLDGVKGVRLILLATLRTPKIWSCRYSTVPPSIHGTERALSNPRHRTPRREGRRLSAYGKVFRERCLRYRTERFATINNYLAIAKPNPFGAALRLALSCPRAYRCARVSVAASALMKPPVAPRTAPATCRRADVEDAFRLPSRSSHSLLPNPEP